MKKTTKGAVRKIRVETKEGKAMHEAEKLVHGIRSQHKALTTLLDYLESQERWSEEDLGYCRSTLRRVARELIAISRGGLGELEVPFFIRQR